MFKPINSRVDEPQIRELLEYAVVLEPAALEEALALYRSGAGQLYGYEDEGEVVGVIGFRVNDSRVLEIIHLVVRPESRMQGYGRGLVLLALSHANPESIASVTDEEGAQFFRSIGFQITGLGGGPYGEERFRCVYNVDEENED
ncbi:GNAT family N-acetyltransferase [Paenibacillus macerans]|uniref:GNAT family N-acetyltransferase n=1 Tax=Paenibacillus macerans TaxID=44252 RepID=UPI002E226B29|nr:GNAT family N-acetyltransferase [Paenibacillus macerans]MED4955706.1 GNAT family N-acetyltransferase [Paenibacillus macerans]